MKLWLVVLCLVGCISCSKRAEETKRGSTTVTVDGTTFEGLQRMASFDAKVVHVGIHPGPTNTLLALILSTNGGRFCILKSNANSNDIDFASTLLVGKTYRFPDVYMESEAFERAITPAEEKLRQIWTAEGVSVERRAEAVNGCFTNGTPMPVVIRILGTNFSRITPYSMVSLNGSHVTCWLEYSFGAESVSIHTTAELGQNPTRARFTSAGHSIPVQTISK
jgi:hypothetical protein